jgi:hypothetical protein
MISRCYKHDDTLMCSMHRTFVTHALINIYGLDMIQLFFLCKHTRSPDAFNSTQQVHSQQQSKKPKGRDRQDVTEIQTPQAETLQQPMLISGHTHASPEPRPTGLCKHTQTCTVHEKVSPTQPNAKLAQSVCNEGCPADPARTSCFVTQRMQEFHCRLP